MASENKFTELAKVIGQDMKTVFQRLEHLRTRKASHIAAWNNRANVAGWGDEDMRHQLVVDTKSGVGFLHLDFYVQGNTGEKTGNIVIATLADNAPTSYGLKEIQVDRALGASLWIAPDSRVIRGWGIPKNARIIVDLNGIWNVI